MDLQQMLIKSFCVLGIAVNLFVVLLFVDAFRQQRRKNRVELDNISKYYEKILEKHEKEDIK